MPKGSSRENGHDLVKRLKARADLIFAWSRYELGDTPPDPLGYDSTARLLLEAAEKIVHDTKVEPCK